MLSKLKPLFLKLKVIQGPRLYLALIILLSLIFCLILATKFSHKEKNILAAEANKQLVVFDLQTKQEVPATSITKNTKPEPKTAEPKSVAQVAKPAEIGFIIALPDGERSIAEKAIALPREFIMSFSPTADQSLELSKLAKDAGHDTIVELPIAGAKNTWGNLGISIENSDFKNQKNFEAALSKVFSPSAVILPPNQNFAESNNFKIILRQIAKNKLYLVSESDDDSLDLKAKNNDVSLVKVDAVLDKPEDLANQFTTLEDLARKYNFILVVFQSPNAENIDALNKWQATLKAKNIKLTSSH